MADLPQTINRDEDYLVLLEEEQTADHVNREAPWRILVVDDDEEVHRVTEFALAKVSLLDRPLELLHVYSAAEAEELLRREQDVAVLLLDVVMESDDAGLQLVEVVRHELELDEMRIILRTGQPGYAPELEVIALYDINDYRSKSELTQTRLITSLISALRSYQQIRSINSNRKGLEQVVDATNDILTRQGLQSFAEGVLEQLHGLLATELDGLIVTYMPASGREPGVRILAGAGDFEKWKGHLLADIDRQDVERQVDLALANRANSFEQNSCVFCFEGGAQPLVAYVRMARPLPRLERVILDMFCRSMSLCYDNLSLIEKLNEFAYYDPLTGLPNRTHFLQKLQHEMEQPDGSQALAVLDIDYFNATVETVGASLADELLRQVAKALQSRFRNEKVYLARIGGDMFAAIGPGESLAPQHLQSVFATPVEAGDLSLPLTATIGEIVLDDNHRNEVAVLGAAYTALKHAKQQQRGGYQLYDATMHRVFSERAEILRNLQVALSAGEFFLVFQPQVRLLDGKTVGLEMLIRWRRANGELVPPDRFIPVAENSGLIIDIGRWVFRSGCRYLRKLQDAGWGDLTLAVNVSAAQLRDPAFLPMVRETIKELDVRPDSLEIEITETLALEGIGFSVDITQQIRSLGLRVSLDDFGTGFSSLAYLQRLNIDRLKVDRTFIRDIGRPGPGERIASTVVKLGRQLGLEVVAEGIETEAQAIFMQQQDCDLAQGYLYAQPMEFEALLEWLTRGGA